MPGKRIAVIGAGVSGSGAIKICLEEGLEPTCFEGTNDIGGLWRYQEETTSGRASVYKSATSNTSKETTTYRDYPSPDRFPNYLHNSRIVEYLRMYAQHFDLTKHIRFLSKVHSVRKRSDFSCTDVLVETTGKQESYVFDGIMVCSGLYTEPILPLQNFPGINRFKGQYIHSCEYRSPEKFQGKKIIVVGIGNSGADLAIELNHVASQVYLSTRRGAWIWNRVWDNGMPMDTVLFTRFKTILNKFYPTFLINRWADNNLNARFNHDVYGLLPKHRFLNNPRDTCRVQYVEYMDEIASEIGAKPNLPSIFLWDPKLAIEIFFGPCTPHQYRLQGPRKWAGARRAILTRRERIIKPLRTQTLICDQPPSSVPFWLKSACAALLLFVLTLVIIKG